jgi:hypothetical protein
MGAVHGRRRQNRRAIGGERLVVLDRDERRPMDRIPEFLLLLEGIGRPADVLVVTAAEWKEREGTGLHRDVVGRGLRLHPGA